MMRSLMLALLFLTAVRTADAQSNPQTRQGFWLSFGLGGGTLGCDDCEDDDRLSGVAFNARMGGTVSQRVLVGAEVNAWSKEEGDVTVTIANITPVVIFYPKADGGFFIKGGIGLAAAELEIGPFSGEETGTGFTLGFGFDARVGRNFALTPFVDYANSSFDGGSLNRVSFGLGFTWP